MLLENDTQKGTESSGCKSEEYCDFCYKQGSFVHNISMEEMAEKNLQCLDEWNASMGLNLTKEQAKEQLLEFLPTLKRWK